MAVHDEVRASKERKSERKKEAVRAAAEAKRSQRRDARRKMEGHGPDQRSSRGGGLKGGRKRVLGRSRLRV